MRRCWALSCSAARSTVGEAVAITFNSCSPEHSKESLRTAIWNHEKAVQRNALDGGARRQYSFSSSRAGHASTARGSRSNATGSADAAAVGVAASRENETDFTGQCSATPSRASPSTSSFFASAASSQSMGSSSSGITRTSSTYSDNEVQFFSDYNLSSLPSTNGTHRAELRERLASSEAIQRHLHEHTLDKWQRAGARRAVVLGCTGVSYLDRILRETSLLKEKDTGGKCGTGSSDGEEHYSYLVIDRTLKTLANAAAVLVPQHKERVQFLRSEAMFACLSVLSRASVDLVVVPMPAPFWGERGSYRRLFTADLAAAAHRVLRPRESPDDPRGLLLFTDCEPYADFALEQLEESRLLIPWTRKNPSPTYSKWLPLSMRRSAGGNGSNVAEAEQARHEFKQQRLPDIVAIAASKSGETTAQALRLIEGHDYKRKYYRALESEGEEAKDD